MSKKVIRKISKKPKKVASPKKGIDKRDPRDPIAVWADNSPVPLTLVADTSERLTSKDSSCVTTASHNEATPGGEHQYKVGDLVKIIVDNPCKSDLKRGDIVRLTSVCWFSLVGEHKSGNWSFMKDQCVPYIQKENPCEHNLTPTPAELVAVFIAGCLSMAAMGLVVLFVMRHWQ